MCRHDCGHSQNQGNREEEITMDYNFEDIEFVETDAELLALSNYTNIV